MKKLLLSLFFFLIFSPVWATPHLASFQIFPPSLYTDDEAGILFTVTFKTDPHENPPSEVTLVEVGKDGQSTRYRWPLKDNGGQSDQKAGDGIYSRVIQFKEKKARKIIFRVFLETSSSNPSDFLEGVLEIKPRPSMWEILKGVWNKNS